MNTKRPWDERLNRWNACQVPRHCTIRQQPTDGHHRRSAHGKDHRGVDTGGYSEVLKYYRGSNYPTRPRQRPRRTPAPENINLTVAQRSRSGSGRWTLARDQDHHHPGTYACARPQMALLHTFNATRHTFLHRPMTSRATADVFRAKHATIHLDIGAARPPGVVSGCKRAMATAESWPIS